MSDLKPADGKDAKSVDLEAAFAALQKDYSKLAARVRSPTHSVKCDCAGVNLRLHFPSLRQNQATIHELVDAIALYLMHFALPRAEVAALQSQYGKISGDEFEARLLQLSESARNLFKRANEVTNRNGEAGELLLYLLTERILGAPQIIAKMSLKTNRDMPVHGADGVHVRYSKADGKLLLYWGEAKLYANVGDAIAAAADSIAEAMQPEKMKREIELVQRNINFAGLGPPEKKALLQYLDPFDEAYNERHDVITCLIGFDFDGFAEVAQAEPAKAEAAFIDLAKQELVGIAPKLATALASAGLFGKSIEIFFFPVPSVQAMRDLFQTKIGWKVKA